MQEARYQWQKSLWRLLKMETEAKSQDNLRRYLYETLTQLTTGEIEKKKAKAIAMLAIDYEKSLKIELKEKQNAN